MTFQNSVDLLVSVFSKSVLLLAFSAFWWNRTGSVYLKYKISFTFYLLFVSRRLKARTPPRRDVKPNSKIGANRQEKTCSHILSLFSLLCFSPKPILSTLWASVRWQRILSKRISILEWYIYHQHQHTFRGTWNEGNNSNQWSQNFV